MKTNPSQLLISNDDGIDAPGLRALADVFRAGYGVTVMAPNRNCSGASHSLTLSRPVSVAPHSLGFSVDGTPGDCAYLALNGALEGLIPVTRFDGVISGINHGANLGEDVLYSGTVGVAREANFAGLNSLAVSLVTADGDSVLHWASAAWYAHQVWQQFLQQGLQTPWFLNLNVPNLPLTKVKGIALTQLSTRKASQGVVPALSPRGEKSFWIGRFGEPIDDFSEGMRRDHMAVAAGWVSLTVLSRLTTHPDAENYRDVVESVNRHIYSKPTP